MHMDKLQTQNASYSKFTTDGFNTRCGHNNWYYTGKMQEMPPGHCTGMYRLLQTGGLPVLTVFLIQEQEKGLLK